MKRVYQNWGRVFLSFFLLMSMDLMAQNNSSTPNSQIRNVSWKKIFQSLWVKNALNMAPRELKTLEEENFYLNQFVAYNELDIASWYEEITKENSSLSMFEQRKYFLQPMRGLLTLKQASLKNLTAELSRLVKNPLQREKLNEWIFHMQKDVNPSLLKSNLFETQLGQYLLNSLQDSMMVVISGYGSHSIQDYVWAEIVEDINEYYKRPRKRPVQKIGESLTFEDPRIFYDRNRYRNQYKDPQIQIPDLKFDILHPMGLEIENTLGPNKINADKLVAWLQALPPEYSKKKIIFVGYSKGTVVVLETLKNHPEIQKRTWGMISVGGTTQGSIGVGMLLENLKPYLNFEQTDVDQIYTEAENFGPLKEKMSNELHKIRQAIPHLEQIPFASTLLNTLGLGEKQLEDGFIPQGPALQMSQFVLGLRDISVYERIRWNLAYLNDHHFHSPFAFFHLSSISYPVDFLIPDRFPIKENAPIPHPSIVPKIVRQGENWDIDWKNFSIDSLFLYLTSIGGHQVAAGGLFDTQVEYLDSKSPFVDHRPYADSLSEEEMDKLLAEDELKSLNLTKELLKQQPRSQIVPKELTQNILAVDWGDLRANHWSMALKEVFKHPMADKVGHYKTKFPQKALYLTALENLALFQLFFSTEQVRGGKE